jgi:putative ATPase
MHRIVCRRIHRCCPQQQVALPPTAQSAWVVLVGATTVKPWFILKAALLSGLKVYVLEPLGERSM